MEEEKIKRLVFQYLDGCISQVDENLLFIYISSSDKNKINFRRWEKEWFVINKNQPAIKKQWATLQTRLQTRAAINPVIEKKRLTLLHKVAAVAAIFIVVAIGCYRLLYRAIPDAR